jgi:tight adherence protein B
MLAKEHPEESLGLVIDSILLQRTYGGDLAQVLENTAQVIRERVELEREVRSVTVQGKLSGYVLAALVPVSAGFLLVFNPTYIEILFDTVFGQIILVAAMLLQGLGWVIISRLVRIRY